MPLGWETRRAPIHFEFSLARSDGSGCSETGSIARHTTGWGRQETYAELHVSSPRLWSPEIRICMQRRCCTGDAAATLYRAICAFRTVEVAPDAEESPESIWNGAFLCAWST